MIVPIHGLKYHKFVLPHIYDELLLVKERENQFDTMAVAAYTIEGEKLGYVSAKSLYNAKVFARMQTEITFGKVWAIFPNQILVELDLPKNTPPNKC